MPRIRRKNCQLPLSKPCIYNLSDYRSVSAQNLFTASPYTFLWMTSSDFATFVSFSKKSSPKVGDPRAPHPQPNHKQGESHTQRGFGGFSGFSRFSGFSGCVCRAHGRPRGSCAMPLGGIGHEISGIFNKPPLVSNAAITRGGFIKRTNIPQNFRRLRRRF